jgi:hypothetical protein
VAALKATAEGRSPHGLHARYDLTQNVTQAGAFQDGRTITAHSQD